MSEIENKNKALFKDWIDNKILLYGDENYKKALEKYNSDYLPTLIKQEWYKYLKVKDTKNNLKKSSWFERLNASFKKNNITSINNEEYMKIKFEELIKEKEKEFENYKNKIDDEYEKKINLLKDLSNKSISEIKEKNNKSKNQDNEKINLLQNSYKSLKKENDYKNEELENFIKEKENIIKQKEKENLDLKAKTKFLDTFQKSSNANTKLLNERNETLSKKLIKYESEIRNLEKEFIKSKNLNKILEDDLNKLNQEKNINEIKIKNELDLLNQQIKNIELVNNDLLSENQALNNKLISKEKEINKKLINAPNIENRVSNEKFSEIYNFEKWMKTKTNLSESSVNKYVNSLSNIRLDLIRMRNIDIFNRNNKNQENLQKLLDIWLSENLEKDKKGNNMYSAGFRKFIIFKSFNETYNLTQIDNDIEIDNDIDLDKLNFSIKVYHSLMRNGCKKLSDIKNLTDWEILGMKNMGESGLLEIKTTIRRYESSSHVLFKENKKDNNDFDNELSSINIKNDNKVNTKSEPINSEVKEDVNQEQPLFKLDFAKLEQSKLEQKQTDERLNKIYSIRYDDDSEIEEEEEENIENDNILNNKNDNQEINHNNSIKLVYRSHYQPLIKFIEDNIDEDEAINKELFTFFINKNSLNEEDFLEEINNFCYEEFNDLLLEEDDDIFYLTKEVFENFKINFNSND